MPHKSDASTNHKGSEGVGETQFDDTSINLESTCHCCCGAACSRHCGCPGCMGQVNHRRVEDNPSDYPGEGGRTVPVEPRNINNGCASTDFAHSHPMDCLFSLGNNSVEATRPLLTQANLAQHTSSSVERENRLEHLNRCVEYDNDPLPHQLIVVQEDDLLPAGEMDEQPLQESIIVEAEMASDHRSRLNEWDRSFSRSSPSASIYLRDVGARYHFRGHPLRLLEERSHRPNSGCRCGCDR